MKRTYVLSVVAAISFVIAANARAQEDSGFYVGIGVGEVTNEACEFDGNGVGIKAFGGYAFNKYFATEVGYIDAGDLEETLDGLDLTVESSGFVVAAIGKLPLGSVFSLFAKLGYVILRRKSDCQAGQSPRIREEQ